MNYISILVKSYTFWIAITLSDRFSTKRNSVWCWINRKSVITIQIWFELTRFKIEFRTCGKTYLTSIIHGWKLISQMMVFTRPSQSALFFRNLSERLTTLGIIQLRVPLKHLGTILAWCTCDIRAFSSGPPDAESYNSPGWMYAWSLYKFQKSRQGFWHGRQKLSINDNQPAIFPGHFVRRNIFWILLK